MIIQKIKRLYRRRKAISPVIAAILLIALTVAAVALVYFVIIPMFKSYKLQASIIKVYDTNKDSQYDQVQIQLANTGTKGINITKLTIWTCIQEDLGNEEKWFEHTGWTFDNPADSYILQSAVEEVYASGGLQIILTIEEDTFYRLEIEYTGRDDPYYSDWAFLNDQVDLSDLLSTFESFNLTAEGFEGTIDDPRRTANNYNTSGGPLYGPLERGGINLLPVLNESTLVPFLVTGSVCVFHSTVSASNLTDQPLQQVLDFTTPFRAKKFFILGLAGSWGDEFPNDAWALNVSIEYTDGTFDENLLGHEYIDDWWYESNQHDECVSAPYGLITEIDLGVQLDSPYEPLHTHTTRFYFNFYKYVHRIIFTDPGNDQSAPHLLSLTFG